MPPALPVITYPARVARDTVEGLSLEHSPNRPWTYWLLLIAFVGVLTALPRVTIPVGVQATGWVRSRTERMEIRTQVAGRIEKILATDNEPVAAGQTLVQLHAEDIAERLRHNRQRQEETRLAQRDLRELVRHFTLHPNFLAPDNPLITEREGETPALSLPHLAQDERNVRAHWAAQRGQMAQSAARLERAAVLSAKGWITTNEFETARHEFRQQQASTARVLQDAVTRWSGSLRDEERQLSGLVSDEHRLRDEQAQHLIRSPIAGTLVNFSGWGPEAFVMAGQNLGQVSPDDDLIIETRVSPRDAGLIRPGQEVRLRIDAFPSTRWGAVPARVVSISSDLTANPAAEREGFKVLVRPEVTTLIRPDGREARLRKGLTLTSHFIVDHRSLWQLLRDRAGTWLEPAR